MRLWKISPPRATPNACPKDQKKTNIATAIERFSFLGEAWIADIIAENNIPNPMLGTMLRSIQPGMLVVDFKCKDQVQWF